MKNIEYYIDNNKKLLEELKEQFEKTDANEQSELQRIARRIDCTEYYIKGLEDAKKYLEESE